MTKSRRVRGRVSVFVPCTKHKYIGIGKSPATARRCVYCGEMEDTRRVTCPVCLEDVDKAQMTSFNGDEMCGDCRQEKKLCHE